MTLPDLSAPVLSWSFSEPHFVHGYYIPKLTGWAAVVVCVYWAIRAAALARSASVHLALCLYGLSWAVLLPFYGQSTQSELLPAFGGFLAVLTGIILADQPQQSPGESGISRMQRHGILLLGVIAGPTALSIVPVRLLPEGGFECIVGTALTLLGYASLIRMAWMLQPGACKWFMLVVVLKCAAELDHLYQYLEGLPRRQVSPVADQPDFWKQSYTGITPRSVYLFAVLKLLEVRAMLAILLRSGMLKGASEKSSL